jgi:uncharacterized protein (TIGR02118 family)
MVKVSVLYRNDEGRKFDMAYYRGKYMPMVKQKLGAACKRVDVDEGLGGAQPGSPPAFVAMCHLVFDSVEAFQQAFAPHADAIMGDIPNYTDIQPLIQVSEIRM